jgi:hypothetical protein
MERITDKALLSRLVNQGKRNSIIDQPKVSSQIHVHGSRIHMGGEGFWFLLLHVTKFDTYNETKALYSPFEQAKSQRTLTGDRHTPKSGFRGGGGDTCRSGFGSPRGRQRCFGGGQSSGGLLLVLVVAVGVDGLGADHCGVRKASRNAIDWAHE